MQAQSPALPDSLDMDRDVLIAEIQQREAIWQKENPKHYDRVLVERQWAEVADIVGCSTNSAKRKWKNLKDQFRRDLRKIRRKRGKKSTWPCFDAMQFMKDEIDIRPPKRKKYCRKDVYSDDDDDEDDDDDYEDNSNNGERPTRSSSFGNFESELLLSQSSVPPLGGMTVKKMDSSRGQFLGQTEDTPRKWEWARNEEARGADDTERDDYHFFMSLIPCMRGFGSLRKLRIRTKIQQILIDEMSSPEGAGSEYVSVPPGKFCVLQMPAT